MQYKVERGARSGRAFLAFSLGLIVVVMILYVLWFIGAVKNPDYDLDWRDFPFMPVLLFLGDSYLIQYDEWPLAAARVLAPITLVLSLVWGISHSVYSSAALAYLRLRKGHCAVLGSGWIGSKLVEAAATSVSGAVLAVDTEFDEPLRSLSARSGVILLKTDATEFDDLYRLLDRDARVFVCLGDDLTNISVARALSCRANVEGGRDLRIWACVESVELMRTLLSDSVGVPGIQYFSAHSLVATRVFRDFPIWETAYELGQARPHLVMVGDAPGQPALAEAYCQIAQMGSLNPPLLTLITHGSVSWAESFVTRIPTWAAEVRHQIVDAYSAPAVLDQAGHQPATAYVLNFPYQDEYALALARELTLALQRRGQSSPPILVMLDSPVSKTLIAEINGGSSKASPIVAVHFDEQLAANSLLFDPHREDLAKYLHAQYADFAGQTATQMNIAAAWDGLSENYRQANRASAAHLPAKLFECGLQLQSKPADGESSVQDGAETSCDLEGRLEHVGEVLSRAEHRRWGAERASLGWSPSEQRQDELLLHPCLMPWAGLSEVERQKDRDHVTSSLRWLKLNQGESFRIQPTVRIGYIGLGCWGLAELFALARWLSSQGLRQELAAFLPRGGHVRVYAPICGGTESLFIRTFRQGFANGQEMTVLGLPVADSRETEMAVGQASASQRRAKHVSSRLSKELGLAGRSKADGDRVLAYLAERMDVLILANGRVAGSDRPGQVQDWFNRSAAVPPELSTLPCGLAVRGTQPRLLAKYDVRSGISFHELDSP